MPNPGKPSSSGSSGSGGPVPPEPAGRVKNVKPKNYAKLAKQFMAAHADDDESWGFMISRAKEALKIQGVDIPPSPAQWAAWRSYFRRKRILNPYMEMTDHWMVPAEWPYLFDSDESAPSDNGPRYSALDPL